MGHPKRLYLKEESGKSQHFPRYKSACVVCVLCVLCVLCVVCVLCVLCVLCLVCAVCVCVCVCAVHAVCVVCVCAVCTQFQVMHLNTADHAMATMIMRFIGNRTSKQESTVVGVL